MKETCPSAKGGAWEVLWCPGKESLKLCKAEQPAYHIGKKCFPQTSEAPAQLPAPRKSHLPQFAWPQGNIPLLSSPIPISSLPGDPRDTLPSISQAFQFPSIGGGGRDEATELASSPPPPFAFLLFQWLALQGKESKGRVSHATGFALAPRSRQVPHLMRSL